MERKPVSGILIINNIKSVDEILVIIQKYKVVFNANPIRILSCDNDKDATEIRGYQQKYNIQMAPALISKDGNITVGKAKICAFLPRFAHFINVGPPDQQSSPAPENIFQQSSDFSDEDEDNGEKIAQRMAIYKQEMKKRNAQILQCDTVPPVSAPVVGDFTPSVQVPPRAPVAANKYKTGEDAFFSRFDDMMEELQTTQS
jgi:hypothetical protein